MNEITKEVIEILYWELEDYKLYYAQSQRMHPIDLLVQALDNWLTRNYQVTADNIGTTMAAVESLPCDLIPTRLFLGAIKDAMKHIDWYTIAEDEDIAKHLKNFYTPQGET